MTDFRRVIKNRLYVIYPDFTMPWARVLHFPAKLKSYPTKRGILKITEFTVKWRKII